MLTVRRTVGVLLVTAAVGFALGVFKGDDTGLRGGLGNLSAPWLFIAAIPALRCSRIVNGAAVGLSCTVAALAGFYAAVSIILGDRLIGDDFLSRYLFEANANRIYFFTGLVTGPLLGAAAVWMRQRHGEWVWTAVGALLAGEIVVVALVQGHQLLPPPLYLVWGLGDWRPYVMEFVVGVGIVAAALWRRGTTSRPLP